MVFREGKLTLPSGWGWCRKALVPGLGYRVMVMRRGNKVADKPIKATSPEEVTGLITGAIHTA